MFDFDKFESDGEQPAVQDPEVPARSQPPPKPPHTAAEARPRQSQQSHSTAKGTSDIEPLCLVGRFCDWKPSLAGLAFTSQGVIGGWREHSLCVRLLSSELSF